jgi:hypothetical protein
MTAGHLQEAFRFWMLDENATPAQMAKIWALSEDGQVYEAGFTYHPTGFMGAGDRIVSSGELHTYDTLTKNDTAISMKGCVFSIDLPPGSFDMETSIVLEENATFTVRFNGQRCVLRTIKLKTFPHPEFITFLSQVIVPILYPELPQEQ